MSDSEALMSRILLPCRQPLRLQEGRDDLHTINGVCNGGPIRPLMGRVRGYVRISLSVIYIDLSCASLLPFNAAILQYSDPVVVLVLAISFVFSVVMLHILGKIARWFFK